MISRRPVAPFRRRYQRFATPYGGHWVGDRIRTIMKMPMASLRSTGTLVTALQTADRHAFFKFMVKSIAEKHGLRATFMPKPFPNLTGNGCHAHVSVWDRAGQANLFHDPGGELGLSALALHFLGGVLHHAEGLCAVTNPIVNSYKRINAPVTASGATWSPNTVSWTGNNRTHMARIPDEGAHRIPARDDGAANPYLLQAAYLAAGLDGIARRRDPGARSDIDMYAEGRPGCGFRRLPNYLLDAVRAFDRNAVLKDAARGGILVRLCEAENAGMGRLFAPSERLGAGNLAGHLSRRPESGRSGR